LLFKYWIYSQMMFMMIRKLKFLISAWWGDYLLWLKGFENWGQNIKWISDIQIHWRKKAYLLPLRIT
jgi:hypothetical protein